MEEEEGNGWMRVRLEACLVSLLHSFFFYFLFLASRGFFYLWNTKKSLVAIFGHWALLLDI